MNVVEELREKVLGCIRDEVKEDEVIVDALISAVIQEERRRILDASLFQFGMGDGTYMMIRTSVVDPKEKP